MKLPPPYSKARTAKLELLQPRFRAKVDQLVARMNARGFDAIVWETYRTRARNIALSKKGTGVKPLADGTVPIGMHELGLAVDVVSKSKRWSPAPAFWSALGAEAKALGLTWGGLWRNPKTGKLGRDKPHVQAVPVGKQNAMRARFLKHGFAGVELVALLLLAVLGVACGRIDYETTDDAGAELVGDWGREASTGGCAEVYTFEADGSVAWVTACANGTTQRVVGTYEVDGEVIKLWPAASCTPPYDSPRAAFWTLDDYRLELNGATYYRDELELDAEPTELCP